MNQVSQSPVRQPTRPEPTTLATTASIAAIVTVLAATLTACGGGSGSAVSANSVVPTAVVLQTTTAGTVSGFGSVYVNGVRVEDAKASVTTEDMDGKQTPTALRLGHSVRVALDANGDATQVAIDAAVVGQVTNLDTDGGTLKVAGQWVRNNTDSAIGPVTVFGGGYTAFSDLIAADLVEVHGSPVYSAARGAYEVQATRIEKKSTISAIRVMGKMTSLDSAAKTFAINGLVVNYGTATLAPATAVLADDKLVAVWGAPTSLTGDATPTLTAKRVRVLSLAPTDTLPTGITEFGGLVSAYSAAAKTAEVQGVKVDLAIATVKPASKTLANGSWVQLRGTFGSNGVFAVTSVTIRAADTVDDTARIKLSGAIGAFTDAASFTVRDVPVDASQATLAASCTGVTLAADVFLDVVATAQAGTNVVLASTIACPTQLALPKFPIGELKGTVSAGDATAKTFQLTTPCKSSSLCTTTSVKIQWNDQTAFTGLTADNLSAATLVALAVKVEGYKDATGTWVAREIRVPDAKVTDAFDKPEDDGKPESANTKGPGWDLYNRIKNSLKRGS